MANISSNPTINSDALTKSNENPFPNENVDPKVKETREFGLKVANAIWYRAMYYEYVNGTWARIKENRDYASGRQDIQQYKKLLDAEIDNAGNTSWMNIDWSISSPAPKYVNILVGDMINQELKIQFNAVDSKSRTRKEEQRDAYIGKMIRKKDVMEIEAQTGAKLENMGDFVPKDMEELEMYMEMTFKESIELAMEDIVDWTFYDNDWTLIKPRVFHDLVENNKGAVRFYWDDNNMIRCRYVDIGNLITSYTDDPYYKDTEYEGEVYFMTIRELRALSKGQLSDEQLFKIAELSENKWGNGAWKYPAGYNGYDWNGINNSYDDYRVQVLDFAYYTTDIYTYAEKSNASGRTYFERKDLLYKKPENSKYKIDTVQKKTEQCYTGLWVMGTEYIVYGRDKNITRPKKEGKFSPRLMKKFIIVEPNKRYGASNSLIDLIKPNLDAIQISTLKMRSFIAESVPAGLAIDYNSINSLADGEGEWSPLKLIKLYKQRGIALYDRQDENGEYTNGKPVEFLQNGLGDGLRPFMESISYELSQIASITGINEARDGSKPDKDSLVGIQKLMLIASNNATRELYMAFNKGIFERSGLLIARMIQDKIQFSGNIDEYIPVIGLQGVKTLEFIPDDMVMADFGIKAEALPTGEELQEIINAVDISVKAGEIRYEDGIEIKKLSPKKAVKFLKWRKKVYQDEEMAAMAQKEQITMQREQGAVMASAEAEKAKQMAMAEREMMVLEKEYELKIRFKAVETDSAIKIEQWKNFGKLQEIEKAAETDLDETESTNPMSPQPKVFPELKK